MIGECQNIAPYVVEEYIHADYYSEQTSAQTFIVMNVNTNLISDPARLKLVNSMVLASPIKPVVWEWIIQWCLYNRNGLHN